MLQLVFEARAAGPAGHALQPVNTWSNDSGTVFARAYDDGRRRWIEWPGLGLFVFTDSPLVTLHCHPSVDRKAAADIFFRIVQPIVLQAQGAAVLHASAAAGPDGALAFCGVSGSGKSTLAWAIDQRTGHRQLADDAVVLADHTSSGDGFVVVPLPHEPRLRAPALDFFGAPASAFPRGVRHSAATAPLQAILVVAQDAAGGDVSLCQLTPAESFPALLTHAYCFDESDRMATRQMVGHYLKIAALVPVFALRYRPEFRALPHLIDAILSATARPIRVG